MKILKMVAYYASKLFACKLFACKLFTYKLLSRELLTRKLSRELFVCVFCLVLLSFSTIDCVQKFNNILNVFHHTGGANSTYDSVLPKGTAQNLELGNLVFYFENKPIVNFVPDREKSDNTSGISSGMASKVFIFPYSQIKDEKLVSKINNDTGLGYKLKIERVTSPVKGVKITFLYDLSAVAFDYKFFDSIGNHKGVVFSFYNKNLIEKLKNLDDRILKTVNKGVDSKKKIVVVDVGHGGSDFGAIGKFGLNEKDVTLSLGLKVEKILKKKGFDVFLTRDCDKTVMLDERTSFANNFSGQKLLVSIHVNSSLNSSAEGLETFCLDNSLFQDSVFFYDSTQTKLVGNYLQKYLNSRNMDSFLLASNLHENVYNFIKQHNSSYKNRGVKKSVSQLLLGSHMPAALIEVGFLSNGKDLNFLKSLDNQEIIAMGICNGIVEYFDKK